MRMTRLTASLLAATAMAVAGPAGAQATAPAAASAANPGIGERVAAVVNDEIVSTYDLGQRMRLLIVTSGVQPTQNNLPQIQAQALRSLIDERLELQELRRVERDQKIDIVADDQEVNAEIADIARGNNTTAERLLAQLAANGVGPETLRQQIRAEISWQRWIRGRYGSRLRIGADQISAYQARMQAAASKSQYQLGEVFIDANRVGGMQAAQEGAVQLIAQMRQGAPFAAVARQFSAAPTAASGGDAGWVSSGEMPPEVDAVLDTLQPGQLSAPIVVRDGVYIILMRDKRAASASTPTVSLKQAAIPLASDATPDQVAAATRTLESLRGRIKSCAAVESEAAKVDGVMAGDLGESAVSDLSPDFRAAAETLQVGQVSAPIRTSAGLHLIAVCGRGTSGGGVADRDQIEQRLFGQQLSLISRRYLRDLRTAATIELPGAGEQGAPQS